MNFNIPTKQKLLKILLARKKNKNHSKQESTGH